MSEATIACSGCGNLSRASRWTVVQRPSHPIVSNGYAACPDCGHEENLPRGVIYVIDSERRATITRDQLLADTSRALRAAFPERAEAMLANIERAFSALEQVAREHERETGICPQCGRKGGHRETCYVRPVLTALGRAPSLGYGGALDWDPSA